MKYSITTDGNGNILAVNRWADDVIGQGTEITEAVYNSMVARNDLNRITYVNGTITEETAQEKTDRETAEAVLLATQKTAKIQETVAELKDELVNVLSDYFELKQL